MNLLEKKFHRIIITIVVFIMFAIISWITNNYQLISNIEIIGISIAGSLLSLGLYNTLITTIIYSMNKSRWLKKKVLSNYYMEGTWIGFYKRNNDARLIIEYFEQDLSELIIRGHSRYLNGEESAKWYSNVTKIDVTVGQLFYLYKNDAIHHKGTTIEGIGTFYFQREGVDSPPIGLDGFQVDTIDGERVAAKEKKISDTLLPLDIAFEKALKYFKELEVNPNKNDKPL